MAVGWQALVIAAAMVAAPERVVLEPLQVVGELPAAWRETAQRRLEEGLTRDSLIVEPTPASGCADATCRAALRTSTGAEYLVQARFEVDPSGRDYTVDLKVVSLESGEVVARIEGRCDLCGISEAADTLAARAAGVQPALERLTAGQTSLTPTPPPPSPQRSTSREAPAQERLPPARPVLISAGVGAGLALATLAAGAAMLAIDGTPQKSDCQSDPAGNCRFLYGTQTGGIAAVSVGAAVAIGSAVLLGIGLRRRNRARFGEARHWGSRFALTR